MLEIEGREIMGALAQLIVGLLAFIGAYLGTKRIKKHLVDGYIEERVRKALNANDKVLSTVRSLLLLLEHEYKENKPISSDEIEELVDECKDICRISEDAGKEVATVSFLLYQVIRDIYPNYKVDFKKDGRAMEHLFTADVVGLVDHSLRIIADYCVNSSPIPFKARLVKRSSIKFGLRKYLGDKKYYRLRHQPFGLTLSPNSEVLVRYSSVVGRFGTPIFRVNLYKFLQSNYPLIYELLAARIYVPLILEKKESDGELFGKSQLHLVCFKEVKILGDSRPRYLDCFYTNISPRVNFVDGYTALNLKNDFNYDGLLKKEFDVNCIDRVERRVLETLKYRIPLDIAKGNFQENKWKIRWLMVKFRYFQV